METSVPCKFMSDSEYSVIKSGVIKRFDCICIDGAFMSGSTPTTAFEGAI